MYRILLTIVCCTSIMISQPTIAQVGWKWARENQFSNSATNPFEDSWLEAIGQDGYVYTAVTTGSQSSVSLAGTITQCGSISVTDSANYAQLLVSKIDSNGNYIWVDGTQNTNVSSIGITTDNAGNVYVLAMYDGDSCTIGGVTVNNPTLSSGLESMYFMIKCDASGSVLWAKNIAPTQASGIGDVKFNAGTISADGAGSVYVSGIFSDASITIGSITIPNTSSGYSIFVAKYDALGNPIWAKGYGTAVGSSTNFNGLCAAVSQSGDLYLAGSYKNTSITFGTIVLTSATTYGFFLTRFDSSGDTRWAKSIDRNIADGLGGITIDPKQNLYITGNFSAATIVFGSHTLTNASAGTTDIFISKYDSSGNALWAKSAGGNGVDQGHSVAVDEKGTVFVTGNMGGGFYDPGYQMAFGIDTFTETVGIMGEDPLFIAKYDSSGNFINVMTIHGGGDDLSGIIVDNLGSFYLCGDWYGGTQVFGTDTLTPTGMEEQSFIARYRYDTSAFAALHLPSVTAVAEQISLFPNPATAQLTITAPDNITSIAITNLLGQCVFTCQYDNRQVKINVASLAPGTYLVRINGAEVRKFVRQ